MVGELPLKELFEDIVTEKATITEMKVDSAKAIFGTKSKMPEDRNVIIIRTDKGSREIVSAIQPKAHAVPKGMDYDAKGNTWKIGDKISALRSVRNQNSWYRRFYEKYRTLPIVNMAVEATIGGRGFLLIKV
jgi:hypothetical protein